MAGRNFSFPAIAGIMSLSLSLSIDNDLPILIDFIVLGIDIEKYESLADDLKTELQDEYVAMFCQVRAKEIEIEDFILKSRAFISRINELELDTVEYEVSN